MFRKPDFGSRAASRLGGQVEWQEGVGLDHIWVPEGFIRLGRPQSGVQLDFYGTPDKGPRNDFPCGGSVEWEGSFRRY